ncbi:MAG: hypothetical protein IT290_12230, partial [Deltaproteobacteria bacterium]|nr:hypothetical protein [Deltaproteobacteria bacterium]
MLKGIRFIAGVLFLLFVGVVFLCSVRTSPSYILLLSIFAAVVGAAIALMDDRAGFFSLGVALCTLPFFGSGTLNLFVLGWVSGVYLLRSMFGVPYASIDLSGSKEIASWALFLFVLPLASSLGLTLFADFDSALLSSLFRNMGVIGVFRFLSGAEVTWFRALTTACGSIVGIMLFFAILSSANVRQNFQDLL